MEKNYATVHWHSHVNDIHSNCVYLIPFLIYNQISSVNRNFHTTLNICHDVWCKITKTMGYQMVKRSLVIFWHSPCVWQNCQSICHTCIAPCIKSNTAITFYSNNLSIIKVGQWTSLLHQVKSLMQCCGYYNPNITRSLLTLKYLLNQY